MTMANTDTMFTETMFSDNEENGVGQTHVGETQDSMDTLDDMGSSAHNPSGTDNDFYVTEASTTDLQGRTHNTTPHLQSSVTTSETKRSSSSGAFSSAPSLEFDSVTEGVARLLEAKLDSTKLWAKKLLQAITSYARELEEAQTEYLRIQRLEHEEAARLDEVEPDVQGAAYTLAQNMASVEAGGVGGK
jgi:hypothetical protein